MTTSRAYSFILALLAVLILAAPTALPVKADNSNGNSSSNRSTGRLLADASGRDSIRDQMEADGVTTAAALAAFKAARSADKLTALKAFGDKAATGRLNALAKLGDAVTTGNCSTISSTVKDLILTDIKAVEDKIKSQQASVDNETTLENGKTEVKSIFSSNRVFAHFIPAVRGICTSEKIIELVDNKVTPAITNLTTAGKDTAQVTADAAAAKTAASDALVLYEKVAAAPGTTATNNTDIQTANTDLAKARASLAAVKADFEKLK